MKFIETNSEKKSLVITSILFLLLFLFIFLYKFKVTSSVEFSQGGEIAIRFGQNTQGSGKTDVQKPVAINETTPIVKETEKPKITTQNTQKTDVSIVENKEKKTQKPNKQTSDALDNILNGNKKQDGEKTTGNGNTTVAGNQGAIDGNLYSNSYYGAGSGGVGFGGGSSWGLNGRNLSGYETFSPDCNETGVVVVQVTVNKNGVVIQAKLSLSGTTNSAPCLVEPALKTAKSFRWKADSNAPNTQIGFVKINFNVGK